LIESVRVSEKGKQQLIQIKRKTGIENWNALCRWALCLSLAEKSIPPEETIGNFSNIEMNWKTFCGGSEDIYSAIIRVRLYRDNVDTIDYTKWFYVHLHRGISYLNRSCNDLESLFSNVAIDQNPIDSIS
jgi:DNA sulfur modification protein DndE